MPRKKIGKVIKGRRLLRLPSWLLVLLVSVSVGVYWLELQQREQYAYAGLPQAGGWSDWGNRHRVLRNEGFLLGYSDLRRNPLWVTYRLEESADTGIGPRPGRFFSDWRTVLPLNHDAYTGSGYDRGHLAPNYAIARVHGREAQLDTFLMTNVSPQTPELNRQLWQRLEQGAMDHFLPLKGELWVITGPVFHNPPLHFQTRRLPRGLIEIPDAFYKIFIAPAQEQRPVKVLAFIMPQQVRGDEPLDQFLVSVREVETATGLDFLSALPRDIQDQLETTVKPEPWQLRSISNRPGRFQ